MTVLSLAMTALVAGAQPPQPSATPSQAPAASAAGVSQASAVLWRLPLDGTASTISYRLHNPERIVVDVRTRANINAVSENIGRDGVLAIRARRVDASLVRIVADVQRPLPYRVTVVDGAVVLGLGTGRALTNPVSAHAPTSVSSNGVRTENSESEAVVHMPLPPSAPPVRPTTTPAPTVPARRSTSEMAPATATPAQGVAPVVSSRSVSRSPAPRTPLPALPAPAVARGTPRTLETPKAPAKATATATVTTTVTAPVPSPLAAPTAAPMRLAAQVAAPVATPVAQPPLPPGPATRKDAPETSGSRRVSSAQARADRENAARRGQDMLQPQAKPENAPITVTFDDADIRSVIQAFADYGNRSIVPSAKVTGKVSATITGKPWRSSLEAVLRANGYALESGPDGILYVDELRSVYDRAKFEVPQTSVKRLNYVRALSLVGSVRAMLSRDCSAGSQGTSTGGGIAQSCFVRGDVSADTVSNSLIITEIPSQLPTLLDRINQLDAKVPMVNIRAKLVFVNSVGLRDIGLAYDLGTANQYNNTLVQRPDASSLRPVDTNGDGINDRVVPSQYQTAGSQVINLGGTSLSGIANASSRVASPAVQLLFTTMMGGYNLTSFLDAVQQTDLGELVAEPNVQVLSNRTAKIISGQDVPVRVVDAGGATGGGAPARATVQFREAGLSLEVTPSVTESGQVFMTIHAENSTAQVSATDVGVIIQKQSGDATVLANNKQTIPIGGLAVAEKTYSRTGIPLLMDLPLIGKLFRQSRQQQTHRDLVILVTPEIVTDNTPLPRIPTLGRQP